MDDKLDTASEHGIHAYTDTGAELATTGCHAPDSRIQFAYTQGLDRAPLFHLPNSSETTTLTLKRIERALIGRITHGYTPSGTNACILSVCRPTGKLPHDEISFGSSLGAINLSGR